MELLNKQSQLNVQSRVGLERVDVDAISLTNFDVYKDGGFFYIIFKVSMTNVSEQNHPLGAVDVAVHLQLCLAREVKDMPVWLNSRDQKMQITEQDGRARICFIQTKDGVEKCQTRTLDLMSVEGLRKKLAAYIAHSLHDLVVELSNPEHRFAWAAINHIDCEKSDIVYHENLGKNDDFVTSSLVNSKNNTLSTNDTGTFVNRNGKFAATVVDGGTENLIARCVPLRELPVYSAAVTAAAMHVVEHGILLCGLQGENLYALFVETVKLLLNAHNIKIEPAQWPQFKGLVLFRENGVPSQFSYSSNGIASVTALPDDGSTIEPEVLRASTIRDRAVLHVSIDVYKFFVSKDDFELQSKLALPEKLELLKKLRRPKRVASFDQLKLSEKTKLVDALNSEKEELATKLREPTQFDFLGKVELSKKMWVSGPLSSSEKFSLSKKLWSSEPLEQQEIDKVLNKVKLSEKSDQVAKLEKLELPQTDLERKQTELRFLKSNFDARKKEVYEMVMQREMVANKLERNLKQAETDLKKKQEGVTQLEINLGIKQAKMAQPEELHLIKTELGIKKEEVIALKNDILMQQREVTALARQQQFIDKELKKQQPMDDIIAQRYSERIKKGLEREDQMFKRKKEEVRTAIQVELEEWASKFSVL